MRETSIDRLLRGPGLQPVRAKELDNLTQCGNNMYQIDKMQM